MMIHFFQRCLLLAASTAVVVASPMSPRQAWPDTAHSRDNGARQDADSELLPLSEWSQDLWRGRGTKGDSFILQALIPLAMRAETARELRVLENLWRLSRILAQRWHLGEQGGESALPWEEEDAAALRASQLQQRHWKPAQTPPIPPPSTTSLTTGEEGRKVSLPWETSSPAPQADLPSNKQPPSPTEKFTSPGPDKIRDPLQFQSTSTPLQSKVLSTRATSTNLAKISMAASGGRTLSSPVPSFHPTGSDSVVSEGPTDTPIAFIEWLRSVKSEMLSSSDQPSLSVHPEFLVSSTSSSPLSSSPSLSASSSGAVIAPDESPLQVKSWTTAAPFQQPSTSRSAGTAAAAAAASSPAQPQWTTAKPSTAYSTMQQDAKQEASPTVEGTAAVPHKQTDTSLPRGEGDREQDAGISGVEPLTGETFPQSGASVQSRGSGMREKDEIAESQQPSVSPDTSASFRDRLSALVRSVLGGDSSEDRTTISTHKDDPSAGSVPNSESPASSTAASATSDTSQIDEAITTRTLSHRVASTATPVQRGTSKEVEVLAARSVPQDTISFPDVTSVHAAISADTGAEAEVSTHASPPAVTTDTASDNTQSATSENPTTEVHIPQFPPPEERALLNDFSSSEEPVIEITATTTDAPRSKVQSSTGHVSILDVTPQGRRTEAEITTLSPAEKTLTTDTASTNGFLDHTDVFAGDPIGKERSMSSSGVEGRHGHQQARDAAGHGGEPEMQSSLPRSPSQDILWARLLQLVLKQRPWLRWMLGL